MIFLSENKNYEKTAHPLWVCRFFERFLANEAMFTFLEKYVKDQRVKNMSYVVCAFKLTFYFVNVIIQNKCEFIIICLKYLI